MRRKIAAIGRDEFMRHSAVFFAGSMAVAFMNYLYHPVLGRLLSVEHFGEVQALFALFVQANVLQSVFTMVALNVFSNADKQRQAEFHSFSTLAFAITTGTALVLIISAPFLANSLQLSSAMAVVLVAITVPMSTFIAFGNAYMQAQKWFVATSISQLLAAGGKLVFGAVLVLLGFAVSGAVAGLATGAVLTVAYLWQHVDAKALLPASWRIRLTQSVRDELKLAVLVLCATGTIVFFSTADVTFAKYYFPADTAGYYGAMAIIARVILFATGSTAMVLIPHVKLHQTTRENGRLLRKALAIAASIGGCGLIIMAIAPRLVITILVGSRYLPLADMLPLLALHIFVVALCNVFLAYSIALRQRTAILFSLPAVALTLVAVTIWHATPEQVIVSFLLGSLAMLISLSAWHCYSIRSSYGHDDHPPRRHPDVPAGQAADRAH